MFFKKWVKLKGQVHIVKKQWYPLKGLITRNTHLKCQSSSTHCSKDISNVNVFKKMGQTQRSRSQCQKKWYPLKGLITKNTHVIYIKALALTVQKLLAKRRTEWQNDKQDKNNMPPDLQSRGHKKKSTWASSLNFMKAIF